MTIPIRNLYYLLLYAWGHFSAGKEIATGIDRSPDLPNLFAKVLLHGARRLLRRGLDRGYREVTEYTRSPRGRLRIGRMAQEQTLLNSVAICDVDELTTDVLHNRLLSATIMALASCRDVERELRRELRLIALRMGGVSPVKPTAAHFRRVQLARHNAHYDLLLKICEFVLWSLMPEERGTGMRFQSILDDEVRMSAVFEAFLRRFYQLEQSQYRVRSEIMRWNLTAPTQSDLSLLPIMKTDLALRSRDHTLIADAKYYRNVLGGGLRRDQEKLRSAHLYQLTTYLAHERAAAPAVRVSGLLVYPQADKKLRLNYELLGFPVQIATIDLSLEWPDIHSELLLLLRSSAHPPRESRGNPSEN